jgi:phosphoribosyl 1,2-cyclic phosphodiesterase
MPVSFTVLASGSGGNASVLDADGLRVLIDCGLGPRQLAARMRTVGLSWPDISAVVLTHTHGDHWRDTTFKHLHKYRIPFFCHSYHARSLKRDALGFQGLSDGGLVRSYDEGSAIEFSSEFVCWPIPISHDGGPTFGFRFVVRSAHGSGPVSVAYLADLGCWTPELVKLVADVDLLALEFNHDVEMELSSGRSPHLVERVLSKNGHLSNEQAAQFVREVLAISRPGRLRHLVQLHLSRDCNHPDLAAASLRAILAEVAHEIALVTADQDEVSARLQLAPFSGENGEQIPSDQDSATQQEPASYATGPKQSVRFSTVQPMLPGF